MCFHNGQEGWTQVPLDASHRQTNHHGWSSATRRPLHHAAATFLLEVIPYAAPTSTPGAQRPHHQPHPRCLPQRSPPPSFATPNQFAVLGIEEELGGPPQYVTPSPPPSTEDIVDARYGQRVHLDDLEGPEDLDDNWHGRDDANVYAIGSDRGHRGGSFCTPRQWTIDVRSIHHRRRKRSGGSGDPRKEGSPRPRVSQ